MGNGLADRPVDCERADAARAIRSDYAALAWDQLNLQHALSYQLENGEAARKAIREEKARRLPEIRTRELAKLLAYSYRNDNPADITLILAEQRRREPKAKPIKVQRYATGEAVTRAYASRAAINNPAPQFGGEARDGFGGSERSLVDGASVVVDILHRAAHGDWRKRPDIVADRARTDRPAGYPYTMATDFCIALDAWGRECRASLSGGASFPKAKGYSHV